MRWVDPPTSAFMLEWRLASRAGPVDYRWVDYQDISPWASLAVIAAEDQRFFDHRGFDFASIRDAVGSYTRTGRMRGASTISQQVAKNLFLWSGRSALRKALEASLTAAIEMAWRKRRILEVYLNIAEMGPGIFGVEAASRRFFRKGADELSAEEAALLAAVLPNPRVRRVDRPSPLVLKRRAWILGQMRQLGGLDFLREKSR